MQIQITDVRVTTPPGKKYQQAEIAYRDYQGSAKTWKILSFSNPAVFATLSVAKANETYEITLGKNDKDYTVWTSATVVGASNQAVVQPVGFTSVSANVKAAWVPDADKQRLIVKQSSLKAAVDSLGPVAELEDILGRADAFVAYVYDVPAMETEQAE